MTLRAEFLAQIERAEERVGNARQCWNPASMDRCAECIQHLEYAAAAMESAQRAALRGSGTPEMKSRLARLARDLQSLSRVVDASLAFCRGMALRTGQAELIQAEG